MVKAIRRAASPSSLDLSILICKSIQYFRRTGLPIQLYVSDQSKIDRIGLQGDAMTVSICT